MKNDALLQHRVIDELEFDPALDASRIGVAVRDGVVTLSGHVSSYDQKLSAAETAARVKGVTALAQQIDVELPADHKLRDDDIAARAVSILAWSLHQPECSVDVMVERGFISLRGQVQWDYQRRDAENQVRKLGGVRGVFNGITIATAACDANIKAGIRTAFERDAQLDAADVSIEHAPEQCIVLKGHVTSLRERAIAEEAAWRAPGVRSVVNDIAVRF